MNGGAWLTPGPPGVTERRVADTTHTKESNLKSKVLAVYKKWLASATPDQVKFVDQVYSICEERYESGGDRIVECWDPPSILDFFKDIEQVKDFCGLVDEQRLNSRWGEDSELKGDVNA